MIVIKIELWPHGVKERSRDLGMIVIANDGTGTPEEGNYDCAISHAGMYAKRPGSWKGGRICGHHRTLSPYHLVRSAIDACLRGRKTKRSDELVKLARNGGSLPLLAERIVESLSDPQQQKEGHPHG